MVKEGRSMAQEYENEDVLGKKMLSLHPMLQLGILRELQNKLPDDRQPQRERRGMLY